MGTKVNLDRRNFLIGGVAAGPVPLRRPCTTANSARPRRSFVVRYRGKKAPPMRRQACPGPGMYILQQWRRLSLKPQSDG